MSRQSKYAVTKEQIAAMEVVCSRARAFNHTLNLAHMDVKWVLDVVPGKLPGVRAQHSVARGRTPSRAGSAAGTPGVSPVRGGSDATPGAGPLSQPDENRTLGGGGQPGDAADADAAAAENSSPSRGPDRPGSAGSDTGRRGGSAGAAARAPPSEAAGASPSAPRPRSSATDGGATGAAGAPPTAPASAASGDALFCPPPRRLLALDALDRTQPLEGVPASRVLLNSPRSVLCVLKLGFSVPDLCGVPVQRFYNAGLLDAATVDTVQMRIAAEEERRAERFALLTKDYRAVCAAVGRGELVAAIRRHKYGAAQQRLEDSRHLRDIPHYAHAGKLDLAALDAACIDVIERSRGRTMNEIRRALGQKDRVLQVSMQKEEALLDRERRAVEETLRVQTEQRAQQRAAATEQQARRRVVRQRVVDLARSRVEREAIEREAFLQEENVQAARVEHRRALERTASMTMADRLERRRRRAKEQQEAQLEARRAALVAKADAVARLQARERELAALRAEQRGEEFVRLTRMRRELAASQAAAEAEEQRRRAEELRVAAEVRAQEFERERALRREAKRAAAAQRAARGVATRAAAAAIREARLVELEEEYERKMGNIDVAAAEREQPAIVQHELASQVRIEKAEERDRVVRANEFANIGYMCATDAKKEWMDRENSKRAVLRLQVIQEREAMSRAKSLVLADLERGEMARRKEITALFGATRERGSTDGRSSV